MPPGVKIVTVDITGMTCGSCVRSIEEKIGALPGVRSIAVSLQDNNATLALEPGKLTPQAAAEAIADMGFDAHVSPSGPSAKQGALSAAAAAHASSSPPADASNSSNSSSASNTTATASAATATATTTTTIAIKGMTCGSCVKSIEDRVNLLPGVSGVNVSLDEQRAIVCHNASLTSSEAVTAAIDDMGFGAVLCGCGCASTTAKISVEGMTCGSCVKSIEDKVGALPGVADVRVSLEGGLCTVQLDPTAIAPQAVAEAIYDLGFEAEVLNIDAEAAVDAAAAGGRPTVTRSSPHTAAIAIEGMTCGSCVRSIEDKIGAMPGVETIEVSLDNKRGVVGFAPAITSAQAVAEAIYDMGFDAEVVSQGPAAQSASTAVIAIEGMTCGSCVKSIEERIGTLAGVERIAVSLDKKEGVVVLSPGGATSATQVAEAIYDMGFDAKVKTPAQPQAGQRAGPKPPRPCASSACLVMKPNERAAVVKNVLKQLRAVPGVQDVSRQGRELIIQHDTSLVPVTELMTVCHDGGLQTTLDLSARERGAIASQQRKPAALQHDAAAAAKLKAKRSFHVSTKEERTPSSSESSSIKLQTATFRVTGVLGAKFGAF
jgi:Cu+-exporting ATPase